MAKKDTRTLSDRFAPAFAELLKAHCKVLGLKKSELIAKTEEACGVQVEQSYLTRWEAGERSVSRELAARFAVTITKLYVLRKKAGLPVVLPEAEKYTGEGWEHLGWTLERFFTTAGLVSHRIKIEDPQNVTWDAVRQSRTLRIGWVECPPWAKSSSEGPCMVVASTVAKLLGLKPDPIRFETWSDLATAVRNRSIHVTAPIMIQTPYRLLDFAFSKPLGKIDFAIRTLVETSQWPELPTALEDIERSDTIIGYVEDEIGQVVAQLSSGNASPHKNLDEALAWMREGSRGDRRILAAEADTLVSEARKASSRLAAVDLNELKKLKFGLCFAAHVGEPDLIRAIDTTLSIAGEKVSEILRPKA